jgi:hypothetical protein
MLRHINEDRQVPVPAPLEVDQFVAHADDCLFN